MEKKLIGQETPEQIEKWKKEFPEGIAGFKTKDGKIAYFKTPERAELKMATDAVADGLSEYSDSIIESCFIGGAKEIVTESKYYNAISKFANTLAKAEEGELVKL